MVALITGITGQTGSYLAELLLKEGYDVHGIIRRSSSINTKRIDHLMKEPQQASNFRLHYADMTDSSSIANIIKKVEPDQVFNLAAQSHVRVSFDQPEYTMDVDCIGTLRLLESIRLLGWADRVRVVQASTSEMFGQVKEIPQKETTPFHPRSPYGVAKVAAYWISRNYREAYNMFISNSICFNHTSPRRGETFICRKVTMAVAKIIMGLQDKLYVGNLNAVRDFGHAKDYADAIYRIINHSEPDDFVIATGDTITVRDYIIKAFAHVGISVKFKGEGLNEVGYMESSGREIICVDPRYFRPSEVEFLQGDATKIKEKLGWTPTYNIDGIIKELVDHDILLLRK